VFSKICDSTEVHTLYFAARNHLSSEGSRRIYQSMFCPDVTARRRGAELASITLHIYLDVERRCWDKASSSVKLEVMPFVVWSMPYVPVLPSVSFSFARPVCL
jgi:hypothetical protein